MCKGNSADIASMKRICILSAIGLHYTAFEESFFGKSALYWSLRWAENLEGINSIVILSDRKESDFSFLKSEKKLKILSKESWTSYEILDSILQESKKEACDTIVYAWADCPFLQKDISQELLSLHENALTEYCFAEAFPYGIAPEILTKEAIELLLGFEKIKNHKEKLENNSKKKEISQNIKRDFFFSLIKENINSFEIETYISDIDMRMWRINLSTHTKRDFLSSLSLWKIFEEKKLLTKEGAEPFNLSFMQILKNLTSLSVLHSLPAYYALQIASSCAANCSFCPYPSAHFSRYKKSPQDAFFDLSAEFMDKNDFLLILEKIASFSEDAVISLSLWGEALQHPDILFFIEEILKKPKLSLLIETTAYPISNEFIEKVKIILTKYQKEDIYERMYWILGLNAQSSEKYGELHGNTLSLEEAESQFLRLQEAFPHSAYCQFIRIQENEDELEAFIRYWKEKTNHSIIQKYNNFSGYLDEKKVVDLEPLERNPCWHLRRDMYIFLDGSVPLCHCVLPYQKTEYILGNILQDDIEAIWEKQKEVYERHLKKDYQKICENCDEYYTFNF